MYAFLMCVCVLVGGSLSAFKKNLFLLVYKALFIFPCICFVLWKTWVLLFFLVQYNCTAKCQCKWTNTQIRVSTDGWPWGRQYPQLLLGLEPTTFWSWVWQSTVELILLLHHRQPSPQHCRKLIEACCYTVPVGTALCAVAACYL